MWLKRLSGFAGGKPKKKRVKDNCNYVICCWSVAGIDPISLDIGRDNICNWWITVFKKVTYPEPCIVSCVVFLSVVSGVCLCHSLSLSLLLLDGWRSILVVELKVRCCQRVSNCTRSVSTWIEKGPLPGAKYRNKSAGHKGGENKLSGHSWHTHTHAVV